jgi:hypothetical protein
MEINNYVRVLKSIARMALVHKAADEIIIFFKSFGENEINELVVTRNKLK